MARLQPLPPSAASLMASLRDLGYSLETAVADLVDNSISANATEIQIICDLSNAEPVLVIADNGNGMIEDEVIAAMRHGSTNPSQARAKTDLGRFGLGLKTASFSQCKILTVVSAKKDNRVGAEWNLFMIEEEDDWLVSVLEPDEIEALPFSEILGTHGTLVIWRELDRLLEAETGPKRDEVVNEKLANVGRHLSLVFHRFLAGEVKGRKKVQISINGHKIDAFDPFCRKNQATQVLREEKVWVGDVQVVLQPFILPHHSRLSASEYDFYQSRSDFISNQGGYVYRSGRLMAWGDWFRLVPKGESTKLARVQIDFPNSLDEEWTIDIKKSRARPPTAVRERLGQIINKITARSVNVHRGRGQKLIQAIEEPLWDRYADHGGILYSVNADHPLVVALAARMTTSDAASLFLLIDSLGSALPIEMIYSDYSTHPREVGKKQADDEAVLERLRALKSALYAEEPGNAQAFRQVATSTRLFDGHMETIEKFITEAFQ